LGISVSIVKAGLVSPSGLHCVIAAHYYFMLALVSWPTPFRSEYEETLAKAQRICGGCEYGASGNNP